MDLFCDEVRNNYCKVNIDGIELNVALIFEKNEYTNSSENTYEIAFAIVPVSQYGGIVEELNIAYEYDNDNETWADEFPREFYENIENIQKIQLEFQNLTKIKSSAFSAAFNLEEIDLDHNQILYIGEDAFIDLQNLTTLSLSKNNLTVIRSNTFAGAINLRRLNLNQNKIERIEDGGLNLPNLENILLQNNRLKTLSGSLFIGTPRLKEAVLEENELTQINEAFTHLHGLEILVLDYNRIEDINLIKFAHLASLEQLSLRKSGFKLKENTDLQIQSDSKLETIDLAENGITDGNLLISKLKLFRGLQVINAEYNEIPKIGSIFDLRKTFPDLQIVNLSYNPIRCEWVDNFVDYLFKQNIKVYPWLNSRNGCVSDEDS